MATNYQKCIKSKLGGKHFGTRKKAQDAMRKAAKECKGK